MINLDCWFDFRSWRWFPLEDLLLWNLQYFCSGFIFLIDLDMSPVKSCNPICLNFLYWFVWKLIILQIEFNRLRRRWVGKAMSYGKFLLLHLLVVKSLNLLLLLRFLILILSILNHLDSRIQFKVNCSFASLRYFASG